MPVTVIPISGPAVTVRDFNQKGAHYYKALRNSRTVKLSFEELQTIEFSKPGHFGYRVFVTFTDGRQDHFKLLPLGNMEGHTESGPWNMSHRKVKAIQFTDEGKEINAKAASEPAEPRNAAPRKKPEPPVLSDSNTQDQIILKNGENLNGEILTTDFTLSTFYASLKFNRSEIEKLDFQGSGENADVLILKTGDRLSGLLNEQSIHIRTESGEEKSVTKDTVKAVLFRP